jgi:hypothetical protein
VRQVFIDHFNEVYELYGRRVEAVDYESQHGNSTAEAQSQGREGACLDAEQIVRSWAFAVSAAAGAERSLLRVRRPAGPDGASTGRPTSPRLLPRHSPYVWNTTMNCEQISYQVAEYIGKRLLGRRPGGPGTPCSGSERKFGVYVPNNDAYQHCVNIPRAEFAKEQYGERAARYNYTLDVSRFPDEAARAIMQFRRRRDHGGPGLRPDLGRLPHPVGQPSSTGPSGSSSASPAPTPSSARCTTRARSTAACSA